MRYALSRAYPASSIVWWTVSCRHPACDEQPPEPSACMSVRDSWLGRRQVPSSLYQCSVYLVRECDGRGVGGGAYPREIVQRRVRSHGRCRHNTMVSSASKVSPACPDSCYPSNYYYYCFKECCESSHALSVPPPASHCIRMLDMDDTGISKCNACPGPA